MPFPDAATTSHPSSLADDMLSGAEEMASFTGNTLRRAHYALEKGMWPAFKEGGRWRMRKSTYLRFVEQRESEALARLEKSAA